MNVENSVRPQADWYAITCELAVCIHFFLSRRPLNPKSASALETERFLDRGRSMRPRGVQVSRRNAVVKRVEHISTIVLVNI